MKTKLQGAYSTVIAAKIMSPLLALLCATHPLVQSCSAYEDPPGCSLNNGGNGNSVQFGIGFMQSQARLGDRVSLRARIGVDSGACRAVNVTCSLYLTTGKLTNLLEKITLEPGVFLGRDCEFRITPELIGAGVSSPDGSLPGTPGIVKVIAVVEGMVLTGATPERLLVVRFPALSIVTSALRVKPGPKYPQDQAYFPVGENVQSLGCVASLGGVSSPNGVVTHGRVGQLQPGDSTHGQPLLGNAAFSPGECATLNYGSLPTPQEMGGQCINGHHGYGRGPQGDFMVATATLCQTRISRAFAAAWL